MFFYETIALISCVVVMVAIVITACVKNYKEEKKRYKISVDNLFNSRLLTTRCDYECCFKINKKKGTFSYIEDAMTWIDFKIVGIEALRKDYNENGCPTISILYQGEWVLLNGTEIIGESRISSYLRVIKKGIDSIKPQLEINLQKSKLIREV